MKGGRGEKNARREWRVAGESAGRENEGLRDGVLTDFKGNVNREERKDEGKWR